MNDRSTNYTAALRKAQAEGAEIACAMQPYLDRRMEYKPRTKGDPSPWVLAGSTSAFRFNGRECKAVTPNGGGPWSVARLLRLDGGR